MTSLFSGLIDGNVLQVAILGIVAGFIMSLLGKWASATPWSNSKFAYTWVIATVAALGTLSSVTLTSANLIPTLLGIIGASFVVNKGLQSIKRVHNRGQAKTA